MRQTCQASNTHRTIDILGMHAGFVLSGYFQGKRNAEHAMAESYPDQGVCLRPGFIHGTRYLSGVGIPLGLIGEAHAA